MELAILSDTHVPEQAEDLPEPFRDRIAAADHVVPPVASVSVEEVSFVVSHGMVNFVERAVGSTEGVVFDEEDWFDAVVDVARARVDDDETLVGVAGHSHEVVTETRGDVTVLNPGSATGVGGDDVPATMLTVEVADGEVDVTVHSA